MRHGIVRRAVPRWEAATVVGHGQPERPLGDPQPDCDPGGRGVTHDVRQRLLRGPEECQLGVGIRQPDNRSEE